MSTNLIRDVLLSHFQSSGLLEKDGIIKCSVVPLDENVDGFASQLFNVVMCCGQETKFDLVVKVLPESKVFRIVTKSENQFYNESLMYSEIIPIFNKHLLMEHSGRKAQDLFPKCNYSLGTTEQAMIAVENLSVSEFVLGPRTFDLKHLLFAIKGLATFHAVSYASKKTDNQQFSNIVGQLKVVRQVYDPKVVKMIAEYPLQLLKERCPQQFASFAETITKMKETVLEKTEGMEKLFLPEEPFAVLCHGDFNRNNILFKYGENGELVDMKLIDFQLCSYSSPGIDMATILYLNTTAELRKKHWNEIFLCYHYELISSLSELLKCSPESLFKEYSVNNIKEEFHKHALCGYLVASLFLFRAIADKGGPPKFEKDFTEPSAEAVIKLLEKERNEYSEETKIRLTEMAKEFLERDLIKYFL